MLQKSEVMKKLNGKLRVLKKSDIFKSKELNSTAARLLDKNGKEDYVLIMNMKDNTHDSVAVSINYKGKTEDDATIVVSRAKAVFDPENGFYGAYRSEKIERSEPMSFQQFSILLNDFNRTFELNQDNKSRFVSVFSEVMKVGGENKVVSRPRMR